MIVELTPLAYTALCALVEEALQEDSDASPLLHRVAKEMTHALANDATPIAHATSQFRLRAAS